MIKWSHIGDGSRLAELDAVIGFAHGFPLIPVSLHELAEKEAEMTTPTVSEQDLMIAAYRDANERRGTTPETIEFRYFEATEDFPEDDGKPAQRFVCLPKETFKATLSDNPLVQIPAAMSIARNWTLGPRLTGWYAQPQDKTGSRTWYYRGSTVQDVINFYQEL